MITSYSDFKFENDLSILYASHIIIAEGSTIYRVVVRQEGDKYITHMENLVFDGNTWKHRDFYWGHYYDDYDEAIKDFNVRSESL
jgi:hypothetical protein